MYGKILVDKQKKLMLFQSKVGFVLTKTDRCSHKYQLLKGNTK